MTITSRQYVLGFPIDLCDESSALSLIRDCWQSNRELHVITLNAEMIMTARTDKRLENIIKEAQLVIPDGAGIVVALRLQGYETHRLPGIQLAYSSLEIAAKDNIPVALVGGSPEVLNYLKHHLPQQIEGLNLVMCQDGYFDTSKEEEIIERINSSGARLVLVALGVPKQEYFIQQALNSNKHTIFIGVGGSFDIWAGKKQRAPKLWQDCNLEWLYRLIKEPWRFKRMGSTLPNFIYHIILDRVKTRLLKNSNNCLNGFSYTFAMFLTNTIENPHLLPLRLLATLGDAVCNLIERERAIDLSHSAQQMHEKSKKRVNAYAQAQDLDKIMPLLTEQELDLVRRASNLKANNYRKSGQIITRKSTAYEALLGYLYLSNFKRLQELVLLLEPKTE